MEFFNMFSGLALAFLGAGLAVGLCCIGSARGTGMVGEAASGVLSVTPERMVPCLVLQVLPGTQGLYGLVVWFFALSQMGTFSGGIQNVTLTGGFSILIACLPIMLGGFLSAIYQGRVATAAINIVAKKPDDWSKGVVLCVIVEFYALISLIASILMLTNVNIAA